MKPEERLSEYFTLGEFQHSNTAVRLCIKNEMTAGQIKNAQALCKNILDVIRDHYDRAVIISSGFRSEALNKAIGGATTSQHCVGQAADFTVNGVTIEQVFNDIKNGKIARLKYDQLIHEGTWIHISYSPRMRHENLIAHFTKGKPTTYTKVV